VRRVGEKAKFTKIQMLLRILIASLSVLRPAVHHVALPGHGVRERATTPQAVSLGSPPNSAYDMTSGELADKLRSLGVNWSERMRVRLTGINGKTLLETRKHELTQQAGIGLHTAAVMQQVVREIEQERQIGASPPPPACKDDAPSPTPARHVPG